MRCEVLAVECVIDPANHLFVEESIAETDGRMGLGVSKIIMRIIHDGSTFEDRSGGQSNGIFWIVVNLPVIVVPVDKEEHFIAAIRVVSGKLEALASVVHEGPHAEDGYGLGKSVTCIDIEIRIMWRDLETRFRDSTGNDVFLWRPFVKPKSDH